jgi:hypothetical protein
MDLPRAISSFTPAIALNYEVTMEQTKETHLPVDHI